MNKPRLSENEEWIAEFAVDYIRLGKEHRKSKRRIKKGALALREYIEMDGSKTLATILRVLLQEADFAIDVNWVHNDWMHHMERLQNSGASVARKEYAGIGLEARQEFKNYLQEAFPEENS